MEQVDQTPGYLTQLECAECDATYSADVERHLCVCGGPLLARYDLARLAAGVARDVIAARSWGAGLWRYAELLPLDHPATDPVVTLGEGATPLLDLPWLSQELEASVSLKDEGINPTGAF